MVKVRAYTKKYMNLEQKLLLCNVNINVNEIFLREDIISEYAKVNMKIYFDMVHPVH
jgi:hypothetical protein